MSDTSKRLQADIARALGGEFYAESLARDVVRVLAEKIVYLDELEPIPGMSNTFRIKGQP